MSSETTPSTHVSVLFGKGLLGVQLVLLMVLIYFHIVPLVIFLIFFTVMNGLVIIWKSRALAHLSPSISLERSRIFVGESLQIRAEVFNDKLLPLTWLEFELAGSPRIRWLECGAGPYRIRLLWLLWKQRVSWEITAFPEQRGLYELGNITLRSGDGFRFTEEENTFELNQPLYVWPKLIPVHTPHLNLAMRWAMQGSNKGFLEDPLLVNGIRDYQHGDEWRRISWQASARIGRLQTNVYQPVLLQSVRMFIDVNGFESEDLAESFETLISTVASLAADYEQQGISVQFSTNASTIQAAGITAVIDELAKLSTVSLGLWPNDVREQEPLFFFCRQITIDHLHWYQTLDKSASVIFYREQDSEDQVLFQGVCAMKLTAELRAGRGGC